MEDGQVSDGLKAHRRRRAAEDLADGVERALPEMRAVCPDAYRDLKELLGRYDKADQGTP